MKARRVGVMVAFVALAVGLIISTLLYVEARNARDHAQAETLRVKKIAEFLGSDMFKAATQRDKPVKELTVKDVLDSAAVAVQRRFAEEPDLASRLFESLGHSYLTTENYQDARLTFLKAMEAYRRSESGVPGSVEVARELIYLDFMMGKLPTTISGYESIMNEAVATPDVTAKELLDLQIAIARGHIQLGHWNSGLKQLEKLFQIANAEPAAYQQQLISIEMAMGYTCDDLHRYEEAEANLTRVIARATKLHNDQHLDVARARLRLGHVYTEMARFDDARRELNMAKSIARTWVDDDSGYMLGIRLYGAILAGRVGEYAEAERELYTIIEVVKTFNASTLDQLWAQLHPLGRILRDEGRFVEAEAALQSALESAQRGLGPDHLISRMIMLDLADVLNAQSRSKDAYAIVKNIAAPTTDEVTDAHPFSQNLRSLSQTIALRLSAREAVGSVGPR